MDLPTAGLSPWARKRRIGRSAWLPLGGLGVWRGPANGKRAARVAADDPLRLLHAFANECFQGGPSKCAEFEELRRQRYERAIVDGELAPALQADGGGRIGTRGDRLECPLGALPFDLWYSTAPRFGYFTTTVIVMPASLCPGMSQIAS